MLYGKNVQCGIKTRSAQNPPESGIVSPPNHGNESPVDFGHSAKRKPQHPVSMQQRIKTGLLGPETVEKLANAATEVVNKHDDVVEPSTLIPGFNDELEKYLGQDNFADFFANLDFDEGLYGTPGTSYQPIPSPKVQDFDIRNIPIEENRSGTNEKPISREDKILKEKSLPESGPALTWIKTAIEKPSEAKLPQETPGRKRRNLIPYSQRPIIGYHSRPRKNTSEYPSIITNSITTISTEDPIFYPNITPKPSTSQNRERPQKPVEETAPNLIEIVEEKENLGLISLEECKIEEIMTDELMEFRKSIDKLIKSYEHMRNENIQHEAGIKSLKKLLQDKEEEIKRTRNENIQHEAEIKCLKTSLQDKEEEIKRTYTEFKRARSEKEANDASVEIMKSEIDSLRKQMKESQEVKNLKTELKEAKQELEELRAENDSLIERINVVSQALAPILIRPKTPRRGSKREHTTDSDDEDNDSKLPRRMVVINEDESTPQKSNATNQSTTSEITSIAESDQMEQERQGHKLEASISSMKLSPPAALISPLPEKFMFFQQQAMQNFDLPLQNGEKEIQSYELHDQLQMSPTHTNEESLAELVRPKSNQSAHSNGLEEGEVTTPVKVPIEKKELPKISFTIHSPTKLPTPSHLQVTKKEETAPKKPNSMKLTAAMSQIQETKTKVKDEKARLLSKIPSATTSTADVVANFLDSQGKYETKRQTDKKRPEEPSRLLHDHKKVMLKDPRDDRKLESNRRSREHDSRRSHSPETSRASSQSMNRGDRKPPPPLSKREAPSRSFKPDVKKPGHRHSVDRNLEKDKEKDKGEKNQGHGHILHIRDSGTNMHWECSPPVLTKETPKSEKTQIVEKISQTTLDAVQQGSQAFAQIQQSFALQQTIINGLDIDRDPKLFDFPGANSAKYPAESSDKPPAIDEASKVSQPKREKLVIKLASAALVKPK
uniref:Uncharacterized protein n=1 Tax=Acrobeloides nanus TaxID=290746 RepID=A0A914DDX2_9BILA